MVTVSDGSEDGSRSVRYLTTGRPAPHWLPAAALRGFITRWRGGGLRSSRAFHRPPAALPSTPVIRQGSPLPNPAVTPTHSRESRRPTNVRRSILHHFQQLEERTRLEFREQHIANVARIELLLHLVFRISKGIGGCFNVAIPSI